METDKSAQSSKKPDQTSSAITPTKIGSTSCTNASMSTLIPWVAIALVLIVAITLLFVWQVSSKNMALNAKLQADNKQLQKSIARTDNQTTLLKEQIAAQFQRQQEELARFQTTVRQLNETSVSRSQDWLLDEAHYFIRMANYQLQFERNVPMAMKLLQMANDNLKQSHSAQALSLRQTISDNVATLRTVSSVDTEALYLSLITLNKQIDALPLKISIQPTRTDNPASTAWWESFLKSMNQVKKLVVIRRHEEISHTLLQTETINQLYQNMHLHIATAQFSLLQKQNVIYHESLQQLIQWVEHYFDVQSDITQQWLADVKKLNQVNIDPRIPAIDLPPINDHVISVPRPTLPVLPQSVPTPEIASEPEMPSDNETRNEVLPLDDNQAWAIQL